MQAVAGDAPFRSALPPAMSVEIAHRQMIDGAPVLPELGVVEHLDTGRDLLDEVLHLLESLQISFSEWSCLLRQHRPNFSLSGTRTRCDRAAWCVLPDEMSPDTSVFHLDPSARHSQSCAGCRKMHLMDYVIKGLPVEKAGEMKALLARFEQLWNGLWLYGLCVLLGPAVAGPSASSWTFALRRSCRRSSARSCAPTGSCSTSRGAYRT